MSRWERFKHWFGTCKGPRVKVEYHPPRGGTATGYGAGWERRLDEILYGATLTHWRCSTCGKTWTRRKLGDWREGEAA